MNKEFSIESFIEYCDDMVIANEGVVKDAFMKNPMTGAGFAMMAVAGLYLGGQMIKAKVSEKVVKKKEKSMKKNHDTVYMLSDKKMEDVFKVSGKIYLETNIANALTSLAFAKSGMHDHGHSIKVHEQVKSVLNKRFYLYTLDGTSATAERMDAFSYGVSTKTDLPIKNVEEGTYKELLENHNVKIDIITSDVSGRKQMATNLGKEFVSLVNKAGITNGVISYSGLSDFIDEVDEFIYGFEDMITIAGWDIWEYRPDARTAVENGECDEFYKTIDNVVAEMSNKYKNITFSQDCDWDSGCIYATVKKK